jgi:hypothetical protein
MLTRIREPIDGTFVVTVFDGQNPDIETRTTHDLAEALAWQQHVQMHGKLPDQPQDEPEVKAAKKKGAK